MKNIAIFLFLICKMYNTCKLIGTKFYSKQQISKISSQNFFTLYVYIVQYNENGRFPKTVIFSFLYTHNHIIPLLLSVS